MKAAILYYVGFVKFGFQWLVVASNIGGGHYLPVLKAVFDLPWLAKLSQGRNFSSTLPLNLIVITNTLPGCCLGICFSIRIACVHVGGESSVLQS